MTNWWEQPYKGGPMVKVKGFPRPLYPPDSAPGKTPSVDGPDVVAYKRTVWRAGRWLGPASNFDEAFSNAFSHGRSGNVSETGVAGVQRQQNIEPTGFVGKNTFNTLRSIRVPTGPHEGEMAMDATAAKLIDEAWEMFNGKELSKINLGPIEEGGPSVREYDLTHETSGLSYYPAFDSVWYAGRRVLAPESLTVTRVGTASHGMAFYADGHSGLRWWFGHLAVSPTVGEQFYQGETIGTVAPHPEAPHVHTGINVERLWGTGEQMSHHDNYTHGAPLIGAQLDAGHPL
jgi:hypothetical protein